MGVTYLSVSCIQLLDPNLVVNNMINRDYALVFEGSSFDENSTSAIIPVKSRRDVELLLLCLGETAGVFMDESARQRYPDVWDWLWGHTYSEIFASLKWTCREEDEVLQVIERIPIPKALNTSSLKLYQEAPEPERIDSQLVHKKKTENVLISKPHQCGNMFYFNGFHKSSEFNMDHSSDHLEGIILFEAARQAGIASIHLSGIPLSGKIVILNTITRYTKFVECSEPYLIRTIPVVKQKGGCSFGVYQIIQNDFSCATGYITGIVYRNNEVYQKFRNMNMLQKYQMKKRINYINRSQYSVCK